MVQFNEVSEPLIECRHISTIDQRQAISLRQFENVQLLNVRNDPRFVAIDSDEADKKFGKGFPNGSKHKRNPSLGPTTEMKTFDGAPIYRVGWVFIQIFGFSELLVTILIYLWRLTHLATKIVLRHKNWIT